jgi:hypothetical protein
MLYFLPIQDLFFEKKFFPLFFPPRLIGWPRGLYPEELHHLIQIDHLTGRAAPPSAPDPPLLPTVLIFQKTVQKRPFKPHSTPQNL